MINKKLTKEVVNERLKDRPIKLIGEYVNHKTKSLFRCQCEHQWYSTPSNILHGKGCPVCSGTLLTKKVVNERLKDRGIELVGDFFSTLEKSIFRCPKEHQWSARVNSILSGKGCPTCAGRKLKQTISGDE